MNMRKRGPRRGEPGYAEAQATRLQRQYDKMQADQAREVAERRKREEALKVDKARSVIKFIKLHHNFGLVQLKGSDPDYIYEGMHTVLSEPKTRGKLLLWPAQGYIQGEAVTDSEAERHLRAVSEHRRTHGELAILAYTGFNFGDVKSQGSPLVTERVEEILDRQMDDPWSNKDTPIIVSGPGTEANLRVNASFITTPQHPVVRLLQTSYALDEHNELTTAPQISAPAHKLDRDPVIWLPPTFSPRQGQE